MGLAQARALAWCMAAVGLVWTASAACPFAASLGLAAHPLPARRLAAAPPPPASKFDAKAVAALNVDAVKADLKKLLTTSQPWWPADNGHYGGLMIRLAWHCNGSYRQWDGRGGCNGARIRFNPELSWDDNTNLDKARRLLEPVKAKYGDALTWGDLIVLAGDTAIESMGGPNIGVCLGRIDDVNGTASLPLGPTKEQQEIAPCTQGDGMCEQPLGQTTMGLIYVNPEGVNGVPIPKNSVAHIRGTFSRMGMNDQETVALIGGGHAFGKTHGACPSGAGPNPTKQPGNPWPGTCGSGPDKGKGPNTFTSGFEGHWTRTPTEWNNEYFHNLLDFKWDKHKGPGGHWQWRPVSRVGKSGAAATARLPEIMMLTADVALLEDPAYLNWVKHYAASQDDLTADFGKAWYKLMTRSMGPATRCLGKRVPPAQAFQLPLPAPSGKQPDWGAVRADILAALTPATAKAAGKAAAPDATGLPKGQPQQSYAPLFATLAWQCASTYRATDYAGGCNGARIRFSPQNNWPANKGLEGVLAVLEPVKAKHEHLTWADLIVAAGTVAVEQAAAAGKAGAAAKPAPAHALVAAPFSWCPGRTDAKDGAGSAALEPRSYKSVAVAVRDNAAVQGLTPREAVALAARPRSPSHQRALGYSGSWTTRPAQLSNEFFKALLGLDWQPAKSAGGKDEFKATDKASSAAVFITPEDHVLATDPGLKRIAQEFAADGAAFHAAFGAAWTKAMNADRFAGPDGSVCGTRSAV